MWYHYADEYRGVVLELACADELDCAWLQARKVVYPIDKPAVYSVDGWDKLLALNKEKVAEQLDRVALFTKSPDWSYENEWRVFTHQKESEAEEFCDYSIDPRVVARVFLGPEIDTANRLRVLDILRTFPRATPVDVSIGFSRDFIFSPVDLRRNQ